MTKYWRGGQVYATLGSPAIATALPACLPVSTRPALSLHSGEGVPPLYAYSIYTVAQKRVKIRATCGYFVATCASLSPCAMQSSSCQSCKLKEAAALEAFFLPEVAVVVIAAWSPLGPPAKRGAEIPKSGISTGRAAGVSFRRSRGAGSALPARSRRRCGSRLVPRSRVCRRG